jgi:hypothetical protein
VVAAKQGSVISNIAFTVAHQQLIYSVTLASYNHAPARAHLATATRSRNAHDASGIRPSPAANVLRGASSVMNRFYEEIDGHRGAIPSASVANADAAAADGAVL